MLRNLLIGCSAFLVLAGCGTHSSDPLASFKALVQDGVKRAKQEINFTVENVVYDVKKTDSLASPYVAELSFTASNALGLKDAYFASYAFQDNRWTLKTFEYSLMTSAPRKPPEPGSTFETIQKAFKP